MAELKFSCPHCGQHISCDAPWAGHQVQCPACQNSLMVPHVGPPPPAVVPAPGPPGPQPATPSRSQLSAGSTQTVRSTPPAASPRRQPPTRPPKTGNPLVKYAMIAVVLAVVGGAGYAYLPGLLTRIQDAGTSKTPAPANAGGRAGPLGEVNDAMDVSDALDGGAPSRPRPGAARPPATPPSPATPTTNPAAKPPPRRPR
jgi:hypothetical protein